MGEHARKLVVCAAEVAAVKVSLAELRKISSVFIVQIGDLRARTRSAADESRALMDDCDDFLTCQIGPPRR